MDNELQATPAFPKATNDGFSFLNEEDETLGIETKTFENGSEVKRVFLKDGRAAVIRELKAWEMEESSRFHNNKQELMLMAIAAKATKIDDKNVAFEDIKYLRAKDWTAIKNAVSMVNFL